MQTNSDSTKISDVTSKVIDKIMMATGRFEASKWNKSTHTYRFSNNSFIEFFSADMSDKLRGARRNDLYINECNNVSFEAYTQLVIRT